MGRSPGPRNQYDLPGPLSEPAGPQLGAFGITEIPGQRVTTTDPASTERQRKMMCADYGRAKRGQKTATGMTKGQLRDFCTP